MQLKVALAVNFVFSSSFPKHCTWTYFFNRYCSAFMIIHSLNNFLASKYKCILLHSEGNVFRVSVVCFKIKYSITTQSLFPTFKCNIFLMKILPNAPFSVIFYVHKIHTLPMILKIALEMNWAMISLQFLYITV